MPARQGFGWSEKANQPLQANWEPDSVAIRQVRDPVQGGCATPVEDQAEAAGLGSDSTAGGWAGGVRGPLSDLGVQSFGGCGGRPLNCFL